MWSEAELRVLSSILDELIPASPDGRVPGAGAVVAAEFFRSAAQYAVDPVGAIDVVLAGVSAMTEDFSALDRPERIEILKVVETETPENFALLVRLAYMGYYSRPEIRPLFGPGAQPVHPRGYTVPDESSELIDRLTKPVRQRGRCYRT